MLLENVLNCCTWNGQYYKSVKKTFRIWIQILNVPINIYNIYDTTMSWVMKI